MFKFSEEELEARSNNFGSLRFAVSSDIEKHVNTYDMFRHYIGDFTIGKRFLSPLREEDDPSFIIYVSSNGKLLYQDFLIGGGDIITFVSKKFNLGFTDSINKIVQDAGLTHLFRSGLDYKVTKPLISYNKKIKHTKSILKVKRRKWTNSDVHFWKTFLISKSTLQKYRVAPISYLFINGKAIKADSYSYVFSERKDNKESLTVYQPFSKNFKWTKSHDSSVFYGWSQLPEKGPKLIITKSMKDVMVIDSVVKLPTVALQNEKIKPKEHIVQQLRERFDTIYLLYDNDYSNKYKNKDNYGRIFGEKIAKEFKLLQIEIPDIIAEKYDAKDISDLAKNASQEYVELLLLNDINQYLI